MSISGIGGPSALLAQQMTQRIHTSMDADESGEVSQAEFTNAIEERDASSGVVAPADAPSLEEIFQSLDDDGNGGLSIEEMSDMAQQGGSSQAGGMGGPPPGGGAGGPPPGGGASGGDASATEESTSTTTVYDEADANQDGEVSQAEQLAYDMAQLVEQQRAASSYEEVARTTDEEESTSTAVEA